MSPNLFINKGMLLAHILGNGPSIKLYSPSEGFVIGCNFQQHTVDVSVVLDKRPFLIYKGNRSLLQGKPIITSRYAMSTIEEIKIKDELNIIHMIEKMENYDSAGHIATRWALDNGYEEIHLWGFDSIWADTQETKTDEIVPRNRAQFDLYIHWREKWKPFISENIIVHNTIEGTQLRELL